MIATIRADDAEEAQDRGAANVGARLGVARIDTGALDAEEHEDGDQHRVTHLRPERLRRHVRPAEEILGELRVVECEDQRDDGDDDRHDLRHRHHGVDEGRLLHPRRIMKWKVQMPIRDTMMAVSVLPPPKIGKEGAERRADQNPVEDVAEAAAEPVAEGGKKSHVVAKAGLGVGKDAGVDVGLAFRRAPERRAPACTCRYRQWSKR